MFAQFDAKSLGLKKAGAYGNAIADASDGAMSSPLQWSDRDENYLRTIYNGLHAIPTSGEVTGDWINRERIKTETYIVDRMASGDFVRAGIALHRYGDLFAHVQGIKGDQPYTDTAGHTWNSLTGRDPDLLFSHDYKGREGLAHSKKVANYQENLARVISRGYIAAGLAKPGATVTIGTKGGTDYLRQFYGKPGLMSEAAFINAIVNDPAHRGANFLPVPRLQGTVTGRNPRNPGTSVILDVAQQLSGRRV